MTETVYYLVEKQKDGRLRSILDAGQGKPKEFHGRMLPDRLARAFRADGHPCFVVEVDLAVETPNILPAIAY